MSVGREEEGMVIIREGFTEVRSDGLPDGEMTGFPDKGSIHETLTNLGP